MPDLFEMHKKPWRAWQRQDGYWYIEDANGHAIASIVSSCKNLTADICGELLYPDDLRRMIGYGVDAERKISRLVELVKYYADMADGAYLESFGNKDSHCLANAIELMKEEKLI